MEKPHDVYILSLALVPVMFLAASATSTDGSSTAPPTDPPPATCSNRSVKVGPNQPTATPPTPYTKDCDENGTLDCGFYTYVHPNIMVCDEPGTKDDYCCSTDETAYTEVYWWDCVDGDGDDECKHGEPTRGQAYSTARAVKCVNDELAPTCEK